MDNPFVWCRSRAIVATVITGLTAAVASLNVAIGIDGLGGSTVPWLNFVAAALAIGSNLPMWHSTIVLARAEREYQECYRATLAKWCYQRSEDDGNPA